MHTPQPPTAADLDVLVVGAGLSGIAAGYYLRERCPTKRFQILEGRGAIGGTWDLFRYPGIRSDSDMYTLGYSFRPWRGRNAIADGDEILAYLRDTAAETGVDRHIRYHRRVVGARWSTPARRWTVEVLDTESGSVEELTCRFLWACTGYYRYDQGYTPDFAGVGRYRGRGGIL